MAKFKMPNRNFYQTRPIQILSIFFPFILFGILYLCRHLLTWVGTMLWSCPFHTMTGLYCVGCGNTRSVMALLRGDILSSLRFNISPIILIIFGLLLYIEYLTFSFKHYKKIVPRKSSFWIPFSVVMAIYFIGRNFIPYLVP